jgi:hypothetical protein
MTQHAWDSAYHRSELKDCHHLLSHRHHLAAPALTGLSSIWRKLVAESMLHLPLKSLFLKLPPINFKSSDTAENLFHSRTKNKKELL